MLYFVTGGTGFIGRFLLRKPRVERWGDIWENPTRGAEIRGRCENAFAPWAKAG